MRKKILKKIKYIIVVVLIMTLVLQTYASSDGEAFITKEEFDIALADFNSRLGAFEAGINSKIDSQVSSYLDRNGIWSGSEQSLGDFSGVGVWLTNDDFGATDYDLTGIQTCVIYLPNNTSYGSTDDEKLTSLFDRAVPKVYTSVATTAHSVQLTNDGVRVSKNLTTNCTKSGLYTCNFLVRSDWSNIVAVEDSVNHILYVSNNPATQGGSPWTRTLAGLDPKDITIDRISNASSVGSPHENYPSFWNTLSQAHGTGHYTCAIIQSVRIINQYGDIKFEKTLFRRPYDFRNYNKPDSDAAWPHYSVQSLPFSPFFMLPQFFVEKGENLKVELIMQIEGRDTDKNVYAGYGVNTNVFCMKVEDAKVY